MVDDGEVMCIGSCSVLAFRNEQMLSGTTASGAGVISNLSTGLFLALILNAKLLLLAFCRSLDSAKTLKSHF